MRNGGPFGQYAAVAAIVVGAVITATWAAAQLGLVADTSTLEWAFGLVVGATIGTAAGASVVSNGLGRQVEAAHTRLDAVHAPSEPQAQRMVDLDQQRLDDDRQSGGSR